jgi:serine phosphatase RsbU (regulator of sigma subunit)
MLRAVARVLGPSSPAEVLSQVNETLSARIPQNMFVTCFYAILVRYDKKATNYLALIKVACILLWYRRQHRLSLLR